MNTRKNSKKQNFNLNWKKVGVGVVTCCIGIGLFKLNAMHLENMSKGFHRYLYEQRQPHIPEFPELEPIEYTFKFGETVGKVLQRLAPDAHLGNLIEKVRAANPDHNIDSFKEGTTLILFKQVDVDLE